MTDGARVVVVGGGIAGVSAAAALAGHPAAPEVVLVETERELAHHTTGRSAALLIMNYGSPPTRQLTRASLDWFRDPPDGAVDHPVATRRGMVTVARPGQEQSFAQVREAGLAEAAGIGEIPVEEAVRLVPALRPELVISAIHEPDAADLDVAGLHQAFVRLARTGGAEIQLQHRVTGLARDGAGWAVATTGGPLRADVVVDAAGAWGDRVADLAGLAPLGLAPLRRTAFMVSSPFPGSDRWPMVADVDHTWYCKPDGAQFLCSPADETPSDPCDARPEELDVALAIDRINQATTLGIRSVRSAWAGLRTFAPDRAPVVGPDPAEPTFIWCVGQGGTGIQTAPAAGRLTADLALDRRPGTLYTDEIDLAAVAPDRFRS